MIGELEEDIRLNNIIVKDEFFVQEAYTFIYDDRNRAVAMGKGGSTTEADELLADEESYNDDAIFGKAITNQIRKLKRKPPAVLPV